MSLPSDANLDIPPTEPLPAPSLPRGKSQMTAEQHGWIAVALVAFLGVAYLGPAIARYRRRPSLRERMAQRARSAKRQMRGASVKARKSARRLGGGTIWSR